MRRLVSVLVVMLATSMVGAAAVSPAGAVVRCRNFVPNANLSKCNLSGLSLAGKNLSGANLSRAILTKTNFGNANLKRANLHGATVTGAVLKSVNATLLVSRRARRQTGLAAGEVAAGEGLPGGSVGEPRGRESWRWEPGEREPGQR